MQVFYRVIEKQINKYCKQIIFSTGARDNSVDFQSFPSNLLYSSRLRHAYLESVAFRVNAADKYMMNEKKMKATKIQIRTFEPYKQETNVKHNFHY